MTLSLSVSHKNLPLSSCMSYIRLKAQPSSSNITIECKKNKGKVPWKITRFNQRSQRTNPTQVKLLPPRMEGGSWWLLPETGASISSFPLTGYTIRTDPNTVLTIRCSFIIIKQKGFIAVMRWDAPCCWWPHAGSQQMRASVVILRHLRGLRKAGFALGGGAWYKLSLSDTQSCPKTMHLSKMQVFSSISRQQLAVIQALASKTGCTLLKDYWAFVLTVQRLDSTVLLLPIGFKQSSMEHAAKVTCGL